MAKDGASSRRMFLRGGVLFAVPIVTAVSAASLTSTKIDARVSRLEAEAAIRELHHTWLRQVNSGVRTPLLDGSVRKITAHHAGAPDRIDLAPDGQTAVGYFDHSVEFETPLDTDSTLTQMAQVQGTDSLSHVERRTLAIDYTKTPDGWSMARVALR